MMLSSILQFKERDKTAIQASTQGTTISCAPNVGLAFITGNDVSISNLVTEIL